MQVQLGLGKARDEVLLAGIAAHLIILCGEGYEELRTAPLKPKAGLNGPPALRQSRHPPELPLLRNRKACHTNYGAVCLCGRGVDVAEVGGAENIALENQAGVVIERGICLAGDEHALLAIMGEYPDFIVYHVGHIEMAPGVQFDSIED